MNHSQSNQTPHTPTSKVGSRSGFAGTAILASIAAALAVGAAVQRDPDGAAAPLPPPSTAEVREHLRALVSRAIRPAEDLRNFDRRFGPGQTLPFHAALRRESLVQAALDPIDGDL